MGQPGIPRRASRGVLVFPSPVAGAKIPKISVKGNHADTPISARNFQGASHSNLTADWFAPSSSADSEILNSIRTLRNRSRDLYRNSSYFIKAIRSLVVNVIGTGVRFQYKSQDQELNRNVESAYKEWAKKGSCDVTGMLSFSTLQQLAFKELLVSGESLLINHYRSSLNDFYQLQILEADHLVDDHVSSGSSDVRLGVHVDSWGKPLNYYLYPTHPGDYYGGSASHRSYLIYPASRVNHLFKIERPGQNRGVSIAAPVIFNLRQLVGYATAEVVKSRAQASISGFVTAADSQTYPRIESLEPGAVYYLNPGETMTPFAPTSPGGNYEPFVRANLRETAAGMGVDFPSVSQDYSESNYSSSRLQLLEIRDWYSLLQQFFIDNLLTQVGKNWFNRANIVYNWKIDPKIGYQNIHWQPRGWSWVDPAKEMMAIERSLELNLTTLTQEAAKSGQDFEELLQLREKELDLMQSYNLKVNEPAKI